MEPYKPNMASTNSQLTRRGRNVGTVLTFVVLIVTLVVGVGAYYYRDQQARDAQKKASVQMQNLQTQVNTLKKQLSAQPSMADTTPSSGDSQKTNVACDPSRPNSASLDNIKASITSGNTAALQGYMAPSVTVIYAASDGLGPRSAEQAVGDVTSFVGNIMQVSWSFDIPASVLSSYGQGSYKQYFQGTALVAKSSTARVLVFNFDCTGKINGAFMVMNESELQ